MAAKLVQQDAEHTFLKMPTQAVAKAAAAELVPQELPLGAEYAIDSQAELDQAAEWLREVKTTLKSLDEKRKSMTRPIDAFKREILDYFNPAEKRLERQERQLKQAILDYQRKVEVHQLEIEAALRDAHAALQEAADAKAAALRAKGRDNAAAAIEAAVPPVPVVVPDYDRPAGISTRTAWRAVIDDFAAYALWCVVNDRFDLLQPDTVKLHQFAAATKGAVTIAGTKIESYESLVAR